MAQKTLNFKSKEAYRKWLAYGHMHIPDFGETPVGIKIRGKKHKVKHSRRRKAAEKLAARRLK